MKIYMSVLQRHYQWPAVCAIYQTLRTNGYQAFLAGGCVRDAVLGRRPVDLDVATNAPPDVIETLFPKTVGVGKSFGVIRVLIEKADIEVATFRQDGNYEDGRHPTEVHFSTPEEDAKRRDFTVNALFLDPGVEAVLDFVYGEVDLEAGVLRAVGDPEQRFTEDHLRILRAVRFSGQLGFQIEEKTFTALTKMAEKVKSVSAERLYEEMTKLLISQDRGLALENLRDSGLLKILFPFRGDTDISFLNIPARQKWKLWSLMFFPLLKNPDSAIVDLEVNFTNWRFANKEKKEITACFKVLATPEQFFAQDFGIRMQLYAEEPIRWACEIMSYQGSRFQKEIERLHINWLNLEERLPFPFLRGEDVISLVSGPQIGECLREAYARQLEGKIVDRAEALQWLKDNYE